MKAWLHSMHKTFLVGKVRYLGYLLVFMCLVFFTCYSYLSANRDWEEAVNLQSAYRTWKSQSIKLNDNSSMDLPKLKECDENAVVTFVMPTLIRGSLLKSIGSIMESDSCKWRLIVIHPSETVEKDEHMQLVRGRAPSEMMFIPKYVYNDPRISFLKAFGPVMHNYGGRLRNKAFRHISTEWTAFLDDDDSITVKYVDLLVDAASRYPNSSAFVFRMLAVNMKIVPSLDIKSVKEKNIGISFAVRNSLLSPNGIFMFTDNTAEDFIFIDQLRKCGMQIIILPHVAYLVKYTAPRRVEDLQLPINDIVIHEQNIPVCTSKSLAAYKSTFSIPNRMQFAVPPNLDFTENIEGLKRSLAEGVRNGCINKRLLEDNVLRFQIGHYGHHAASSKLLIVYHIDDISYEYGSVTTDYLRTLRSAAQVWTFAPSHYNFFTMHLGLSNVFFIPFWHVVSRNFINGLSLVSSASKVSCKSSTMRYAKYPEVEIQEGECMIHSHALCYSPKESKAQTRDLPLCPISQAVHFIHYKFNKQISNFCKAMKSGVESFNCFTVSDPGIVHEDALKDVKVVVFDASIYDSTILDSKSIDSLLMKGKVIISVGSHDIGLDTMYANHVIFVRDTDEMVKKTNEILALSSEDYERYSSSNIDFMLKNIDDLGPLCHAFKMLQNRGDLYSLKIK